MYIIRYNYTEERYDNLGLLEAKSENEALKLFFLRNIHKKDDYRGKNGKFSADLCPKIIFEGEKCRESMIGIIIKRLIRCIRQDI